ncbi:hypothetical protein I2I05_18780 [Hymenobacter sp. BT683]|uniref:Uncharacterized protein n=1 Tax=Hymenobacter jeongseonensis TaxID=2791027 RepID=A0ABS0IM52_9BACT|nr:hypothetical protein [Hymenobacter jeongseonensis]MBF9239445.1 hypothetical protein [Hymenobacter jeongseonensis]
MRTSNAVFGQFKALLDLTALLVTLAGCEKTTEDSIGVPPARAAARDPEPPTKSASE